jgi:hypothetical protein
MHVQLYYDLTWQPNQGGEFSNDTEGQLVMLCRKCRAEAGDRVAWAGAGDADTECEICGARNDAPITPR